MYMYMYITCSVIYTLYCTVYKSNITTVSVSYQYLICYMYMYMYITYTGTCILHVVLFIPVFDMSKYTTVHVHVHVYYM